MTRRSLTAALAALGLVVGAVLPAASPAAATAYQVTLAKAELAAAMAANYQLFVTCSSGSVPTSGEDWDPCAWNEQTTSSLVLRSAVDNLYDYQGVDEVRGVGLVGRNSYVVERMQIDELRLGRYDAPGGVVRTCISCPGNSGLASYVTRSTGWFDVRHCGEADSLGGYRTWVHMIYSIRWTDGSLTTGLDWYSYPTRWRVAAQSGSCW